MSALQLLMALQQFLRLVVCLSSAYCELRKLKELSMSLRSYCPHSSSCTIYITLSMSDGAILPPSSKCTTIKLTNYPLPFVCHNRVSSTRPRPLAEKLLSFFSQISFCLWLGCDCNVPKEGQATKRTGHPACGVPGRGTVQLLGTIDST